MAGLRMAKTGYISTRGSRPGNSLEFRLTPPMSATDGHATRLDMTGDDAFAIGHRKLLSRIGLSVNEPLGPEPPIRVEHDHEVCGVLLVSDDHRP